MEAAALPSLNSPWCFLLGTLCSVPVACLLEATFASQKLEKEGVNMANLVREELSHSMIGEVSITLFCKLSCLQSPQTTKPQFAG